MTYPFGGTPDFPPARSVVSPLIRICMGREQEVMRDDVLGIMDVLPTIPQVVFDAMTDALAPLVAHENEKRASRVVPLYPPKDGWHGVAHRFREKFYQEGRNATNC